MTFMQKLTAALVLFGLFASMRVQTDRVNMPNYITPIICIWVTGE